VERDAVRQWLARDPRRADLMAALERTTGRLAFTPPSDLDVEGALRRTAARRDASDVLHVPFRAAREHAWIPRRRIALRAAAAVTLLIGGALVWRVISGGSLIPGARAYHTPVGRSDSLVLRDGTRVLLGPGSELTLAAGYGEWRRDVDLRGEALFDVHHDDRQPFHVRAGSATVSDVGTIFAVRSDAGDEVHVVVTSGSVVLRGAGAPVGQGVILKGGDRGALRPDGRAVVDPGGATEEDLAWTRGRLVFNDASLGRVRADLRRWYGIELQIADSAVAGRHLTASFAGESAQQVLDVIALALGVTIERRGGGDTAVIHASSRELPRR
jgi:transmembrane sensor